MRFVFAGGVNTVVTYGVYLAAINFVSYQTSFALAYVVGFFLSYWLNLRYVFRQAGHWRKLVRYPVVYLIHYAASAAALGFLVERAGVPAGWAPAIVIVLVYPAYFYLSRIFLVDRECQSAEAGGGWPVPPQRSAPDEKKPS